MATVELTQKFVEQIKPPTDKTQSEYWDSKVKGLGVIVGASGVKTFVARTWVNGKNRKLKIGVVGELRLDKRAWNVTLARQEAEKLRVELRAGTDRVSTKKATVAAEATRAADPNAKTLRQGLELHMRNMAEGRSRHKRVCSPLSIQIIEDEVTRHLEDWLNRPMVDLSPDELERVCDRIIDATPARAGAANKPGVALTNRLMRHVSAIWESLDRRYDLPGKNPAKKLHSRAMAAKEDRVSGDALPAWYQKVETLPSVRKHLQLVALFTGLRSDSVRHLRWDDVDAARSLVHVTKAKGGKPYTIPVPGFVMDVFATRRKENAEVFKEYGGGHGWIFPALSRKGKRVIPLAEPKEWRKDNAGKRYKFLPGMHPLRKTYNSVAIEIGISQDDRHRLMNHEGGGVNVKHYGFPENWDHLAEVQEKIAAALQNRLGIK